MRAPALVPLLLLSLAACGDGSKPSGGGGDAVGAKDHIRVDHILVGVRNERNPRGKHTDAEARAIAYDLVARFRAGTGDWASLKRQWSEDPPPGGPYRLANRGIPSRSADEVPRDQMLPAFSDTSFSLEVGEYGVADFHPTRSYYGYHVVKRIE
jgi:hypothetical protein